LPGKAATCGRIVAIGGAEIRSGDLDVLGHFVACCGGHGARVAVLTTASREPAERNRDYAAAFRALGVEEVAFFHQEHREEASDPALLAAVDAADGVFFTGGSQLKLVSTIAGTPLEARLRARYFAGMTLGGTSAGASALSTVMIARGEGRVAARLAAVRMSPGLGFVPQAIIDQHFRERDRLGRLIAAVLCNPGMLGLGLDEGAAFVLDPVGCLSVVGRGTLTVVDGSALEATNVAAVPDQAPAAYAGVRLHALCAGWSYDLATRRVDTRVPAIALPPAVPVTDGGEGAA
jgi:cyanophycinase